MTSARADSWHESGVRAERPPVPPRPARRSTPPPPLPPLPELGTRGRVARPVPAGAAGGLRADSSRDDRLRGDLQRSRPPSPHRGEAAARDPRAAVRAGRPDAEDRARSRAGSRPPASRPAPSTDGGRLRGIVAVLGVFLATLAGGAVDSYVGMGLGTVTLVALVASTAIATLAVRRRDLISVVLCPPLVFVAVAGVNIALAPSATLTLPTVATLLIRGFPTMAVATAAAAVLALVRLGARR